MPLEPPEPLYPFAVHTPALAPKQRPDPPIPPARMRRSQLVHPRHPPQLVLGHRLRVTLRRAMLLEQPARPTLRHLAPPHQIADGITSARRTHQFPRCRSRSIEISSACSATIFFKRLFSCSNAFNRCASFSFKAPYLIRHR